MSSNPEDFPELKELDQKLKAIRSKKPDARPEVDAMRSGNIAWRMVIELVVGMMLGFCVGFALDNFFNTKPLLILIMTLTGFAGGVRAMMRTAQELNENKTDKK